MTFKIITILIICFLATSTFAQTSIFPPVDTDKDMYDALDVKDHKPNYTVEVITLKKIVMKLLKRVQELEKP